MDAKVSVSLLIEKLQDFLLGQAATSNLMFKIQVQKTINNLHSLKIFLKDAEDREASSGFWSMNDQTVTRILKAIYSADDATELIRKELQQIKQRENQTSHPFMRSIMSLCSQRHFIHEMKKFKNEVRRLVKQKEKAVTSDGVDYHNNATRLSSSDNASRIFDFFLDETDESVGPNKLKMNEFFIKLKLDQFPKVIAVVGEAGLGKTTLATTLYNSVNVKQNFTNRAWIQDASWFDTRHVLVDILRQINQAELAVEATISEYQLMQKIGELLNGGRCLIVLEDVHVERTQILETLLDSSEFDARIIITTRKVIILPSQVAHFTLRLDRLNKKKSWKLFLKKVRVAEKDLNDSKLISLKEKILNICSGLPSAIILLGGLLSTKKRDYDDWYRVIVRASNNKGDILALSYQDLPSEIKPCFLYMGIFPRKFEIPVRRLIHIWVAEGFVTEKSNPEMMAEKYFEELVIRNMIQVRWKSNGSPKTCCLSGALYDFFSPKAEAVGFFNRQFHSSTTFTKESQLLAVRRLAITYSDIINNFFSLDQVQNLRSYVAFNTQIPDNSDAGMFLKKIISSRGFGLLYVLDLEGVYKPMLTADVMRKLVHLKYIGLRSTFIDSLPDCVPSLPCLETLDLKHTNISNVIHIDRAEKLQHLYLFVDYSDKVLLDLTSLTNLHTLWGIYFASETDLSALQKLTTLTKLKLSCPANVFATNQTAECISHLTNLQSLKLKSVESAADDDHYINMGTLENHQKLQDLNLQGRLSNEMFVIGLFPPYLRKLTLSETRLSEDPMPLLGKLPHLYILCLFSNSSTSSKFTCLSGEFPKLRLLKLLCIQDLQEWIVEEGAMPCLKELEIRYCKKLKDPQGLDRSSSKQWGGKKGGEWRYETNGGIVEIMIIHKTYINSLSITSVNENYKIEDTKKFGDDDGNANRITIDWPEEYLTSISGTITSYQPKCFVESLMFHTNWCTYGPFGSNNGTHFKFPVEDQVIVGFHGRCGSYLDAIGVVYQKAHPIQVQFMTTVYQG
ncbi:hypothetical protein Q3G72_002974 [Acer saccharum]|nr:hypothetical protein Q3G72_002974 [Acer saccharum]